MFVLRPKPALYAAACAWLLLASACTAPAIQIQESALPVRPPIPITLITDGEIRQVMTTTATVSEALAESGVNLNPADEVDPPGITRLPQSGTTTPFVITVVRVTESSEVIPESIPFERRIVRSAEMSTADPPRILQTGSSGFQEVSVRIVYHDGLETERWPTSSAVIQPPVDEIVMIGIGSDREAVPVEGSLAYIDDGRAIILKGSTASPRQIAIDGSLDGRVFQLSPDGRYLLYTVGTADETAQESFHNALWVISTSEGAQARPLLIENILWGGWDPTALESPRIAYTTARSVPLPPGWEANNDLWLLTLPIDEAQPTPVRLIETYPAAYGWWGGNYAWSPDGRRLAYAFADEIGLLDMPGAEVLGEEPGFNVEPEPLRTVLHNFTPFDTGADWAWVPALSWSADGQFLAFTDHADSSKRFDLWLADTLSGDKVTLVEGAGIWSAVQWSPPAILPDSRLVSVRATDPTESEESSYTMWLSDGDGSNVRRVFPPEGEVGNFGRSNQSLVWGPDENALAFIFDEELHILDLSTGELFRAGLDDTISSNLTWAPYGAAIVR